jgi:hypothetical protein
VKQLLEKDYVLLSLDSAKHKGGAEVIEALRQGHAGGGIPWLTVLDGAGKELVTSDAPKTGNIGCPVEPHEIAWFRTMLERTKKRLTPGDLDAVQKANEAYANRVKPRRSV